MKKLLQSCLIISAATLQAKNVIMDSDIGVNAASSASEDAKMPNEHRNDLLIDEQLGEEEYPDVSDKFLGKNEAQEFDGFGQRIDGHDANMVRRRELKMESAINSAVAKKSVTKDDSTAKITTIAKADKSADTSPTKPVVVKGDATVATDGADAGKIKITATDKVADTATKNDTAVADKVVDKNVTAADGTVADADKITNDNIIKNKTADGSFVRDDAKGQGDSADANTTTPVTKDNVTKADNETAVNGNKTADDGKTPDASNDGAAAGGNKTDEAVANKTTDHDGGSFKRENTTGQGEADADTAADANDTKSANETAGNNTTANNSTGGNNTTAGNDTDKADEQK